MMEDAFVKALSARDIERLATAWREAFGVSEAWVPDLIDILESKLPQIFPDFTLVVRDDDVMEDAEAYTQSNPPRIVLRESVYRGAASSNARCRMTLAHELGHLVLHKGALNARHTTPTDPPIMKLYNSAEWQARKFAAYFLMPEHVVRQFGSLQDLAANCVVSHQAAGIRMDEVGHIRPQQPPDCVRKWLAD